jgi:hypothetical protein
MTCRIETRLAGAPTARARREEEARVSSEDRGRRARARSPEMGCGASTANAGASAPSTAPRGRSSSSSSTDDRVFVAASASTSKKRAPSPPAAKRADDEPFSVAYAELLAPGTPPRDGEKGGKDRGGGGVRSSTPSNDAGTTDRPSDRRVVATIAPGGPLTQDEFDARLTTTRGVTRRAMPKTSSSSSSSSHYVLSFAAASLRGTTPGRPTRPNRDAFVAIDAFASEDDECLFAVFDGHGDDGDACARFASETLPALLQSAAARRGLERGASPDAMYEWAFGECDARLRKRGGHDLDADASGAAALVTRVKGARLEVAHVRNCRVVVGEARARGGGWDRGDDADVDDALDDVAREASADGAAEVRLLPIRPRSRGARRSLRTFPVVTLHPRFPFNV